GGGGRGAGGERRGPPRRSRPRVREDRITMSHGAGRKATQTLIEAIFLNVFLSPSLEPLEDAARLKINGARVALTTDSFVVSPLFFPGGDIADLAVNGTVNDLATSGARSAVPAAGLILGEGLRVEAMSRIVGSMRAAAEAAGVQVVTGDTKVVERGQGRRLLHQYRRGGRHRARPGPRRGERAPRGSDHRVRPDRRPRGHDHA